MPVLSDYGLTRERWQGLLACRSPSGAREGDETSWPGRTISWAVRRWLHRRGLIWIYSDTYHLSVEGEELFREVRGACEDTGL